MSPSLSLMRTERSHVHQCTSHLSNGEGRNSNVGTKLDKSPRTLRIEPPRDILQYQTSSELANRRPISCHHYCISFISNQSSIPIYVSRRTCYKVRVESRAGCFFRFCAPAAPRSFVPHPTLVTVHAAVHHAQTPLLIWRFTHFHEFTCLAEDPKPRPRPCAGASRTPCVLRAALARGTLAIRARCGVRACGVEATAWVGDEWYDAVQCFLTRIGCVT